jgi:hypothetical protein
MREIGRAESVAYGRPSTVKGTSLFTLWMTNRRTRGDPRTSRDVFLVPCAVKDHGPLSRRRC